MSIHDEGETLRTSVDDQGGKAFSFVPTERTTFTLFLATLWVLFGPRLVREVAQAVGGVAVAKLLILLAGTVVELVAVYSIVKLVFLDRRKWHGMQRTANGYFSARFRSRQDLPAFILYFRPFHRAGRIKINNYSEKRGERIILGLRWDIELALSVTFDRILKVIAIGDERRAEIGAAKIASTDDDWKDVARRLIAESSMIVMVPYDTPGVEWELATVVVDESALAKTIFLMPPSWFWDDYRERWARLAVKVLGEHGVALPPYRSAGGMFLLSKGAHSDLMPFRSLRMGFASRLSAVASLKAANRFEAWSALSQRVRHELWMYRLPRIIGMGFDRIIVFWFYFLLTVVPLVILGQVVGVMRLL